MVKDPAGADQAQALAAAVDLVVPTVKMGLFKTALVTAATAVTMVAAEHAEETLISPIKVGVAHKAQFALSGRVILDSSLLQT
jgi:hypothetical protein